MADAIPGSPKPEVFADWMLLFPLGRFHCYDDPDAAAAAVAGDATAVAADTSTGESGYITFTLRHPSEVSYLDLHWPYGTPESVFDAFPANASAVGSHENLVLLSISLARMEYRIRAPDLFVYTFGPSSPPPSLRRLAACTETTKDLAGGRVFLMVESDVGILCRGGDPNNYVVADLFVSWKQTSFPDERDFTTNPPQMFARLCTFSPKKGDWTIKEMLAPQPHGQGQFPYLWYCDRVLPFAGRYLCWVDHYSGLVYTPVPGNQQFPTKRLIERYSPESFRNVSVSQGMIRFVHIDTDRQGLQTSDQAVAVWNLMTMGDSWSWEIHRKINLEDLWVKHSYRVLGLPPLVPEFPFVTKNDPDVLCGVLREDGFSGRVWIIYVDLKQLVVLSCVHYINEQIVCHRDAIDNEEHRNFLPHEPWLPSYIPRYLNKPQGN
ncbi:hypothetical protein PVAP13_5NG558001 [Panicum virgatum]|uniref:DUF1618 domain-containing protein n=1 Tax=Panicum virgatum TaxID=38727 RepID=A0A8T0S1L1_PANVG|nr:hypothetical protein PVAP13_5NG558001 [Panicum virgatum]